MLDTIQGVSISWQVIQLRIQQIQQCQRMNPLTQSYRNDECVFQGQANGLDHYSLYFFISREIVGRRSKCYLNISRCQKKGNCHFVCYSGDIIHHCNSSFELPRRQIRFSKTVFLPHFFPQTPATLLSLCVPLSQLGNLPAELLHLPCLAHLQV